MCNFDLHHYIVDCKLTLWLCEVCV